MYSLSLAEAVARQGVDVTCVGLGSSADANPSPSLRRVCVDASTRPTWRRLLSLLPNQTSATSVPDFRRRVEELLNERWDVVVVDGLQTGWIASSLGSESTDCVVYLAHNHEASMRVQIAQSMSRRSLRRPLLQLDAIKTRRLENQVLRRCDVVSSISLEDLDRFEQQAPRAHHVLVPPGWSGPIEPGEPMDMADRPRRVGILGSFEWHAKQEGLRRFLAVADPKFAHADVELVIAGNVPDGFRRTLGDLRATSFLGWVGSPSDVLASCRIGAIAEPLGGGFKLKALDYVFSDVVVATLAHSAAGLPFVAGSSMLVGDDESRLVDAIADAIDEPALLSRMATEARQIADGTFSWSVGARTLIEAVEPHVGGRR